MGSRMRDANYPLNLSQVQQKLVFCISLAVKLEEKKRLDHEHITAMPFYILCVTSRISEFDFALVPLSFLSNNI
jgi:hypothetical protein